MKKIHYILIPLVLNILGFLVNQSCGGMLCILSGRGFPFGYFNSSTGFYLLWFILDYVVLFVAYRIIFFVYKDFKKSK